MIIDKALYLVLLIAAAMPYSAGTSHDGPEEGAQPYGPKRDVVTDDDGDSKFVADDGVGAKSPDDSDFLKGLSLTPEAAAVSLQKRTPRSSLVRPNREVDLPARVGDFSI